MTSSHRIESPYDCYHIMCRGVGRQILFEDFEDRLRMENGIKALLKDMEVEVYAWCYMDNHFHLLLKGTLNDISVFMRRLEMGYARYFNKRHDRVGVLFQGRFVSVAINSEEQLLAVVRYIHLNSLEAGVGLNNRWSSYQEYVGTPIISNTDPVMAICGSAEAFIEMHTGMHAVLSEMLDVKAVDGDGVERVSRILEGVRPYDLKALPRAERDAALRKLKSSGMTVREIERATSIGRNIIARA